MKVIDLLNKIANGEDVPKKVKAGYYCYEYEEKGEYINVDDTEDLLFDFDSYFPLEMSLNQEVEIIKDEPRNIEVCGSLFTRSEYNRLAGIKEDKKIEKVNTYVLCDSDFERMGVHSLKATEIIDKAFEEYSHKINEIIDYINGGTNGE